MTRCQYHGQCVEETDGMAAETKRGKKLRTVDEDHGGEFDVENVEIRRVEGAESVGREPPTEKAIPEICLSFEETALQLMIRRARR